MNLLNGAKEVIIKPNSDGTFNISIKAENTTVTFPRAKVDLKINVLKDEDNDNSDLMTMEIPN